MQDELVCKQKQKKKGTRQTMIYNKPPSSPSNMLLHILRGRRRDTGHPWEPQSGFPSAAVPPLCPRALQKESERFPGLQEEEEGSNY